MNKTNRNPYHRFSNSDLTLRDQLAIDRTVMANERTFLAYCRTGLALALTGAGGIRFIGGQFYIILGTILIALGALVAFFGMERFVRMRRLIRSAGKRGSVSRASRD